MEFGGVITVFLLAVLILLELHAASGQQHGPLWYSRDQLLALRPAGGADVASIHNIPDMIRKTYRGRRGKGRRTKRRRNEARKERRRYKPYLPSLIMGNVRSLANKMDELSGLVGSQREYKECSLMCFSETWLHSDIPDNNVTTEGFQTVRADRDCTETGKRKGGGVAVLVNNKWCNPGHITTKEKICRPDIELLAVGLRPYYLPREISHVIVVAVYIPPSANATTACDVMHSTIAGLQTKHPSALILISGDFNHVTMKKTLPEFKQYVNCPTRGDRTLDLLYANVKEAYSSSPLPPLGRSDHNLVYLDPCYVPLVKQQPAITKTVRRWSDEALETLRVCFEVTDWQALCDPHGEDIDSIVECITAYINFCVDCIIPTRTVHCYANNKPWVTKDIKAILNAKKSAFRAGNREEVRAIQVDLRIKIRQAKEKYRKKLEFSLQNNDMRKVWSGMKTITGFRPSGGGGAEGGVDRANELNLFFNRFDMVLSPASQHLGLPPTARPHSTPNPPLPHSPSHPTVAPHPSPSVSLVYKDVSIFTSCDWMVRERSTLFIHRASSRGCSHLQLFSYIDLVSDLCTN